jgi:hypothetical protein
MAPGTLSREARRAAYRLMTADRCDWCGPTHDWVRPVILHRKYTGQRCCDPCWRAGAWVYCDPSRPPATRVRRQVCGLAGCTDPTHPLVGER